MQCDVARCPEHAVVEVTFRTGGSYFYCDRHNATWRTRPRVMWPGASVRSLRLRDSDVF